MADYLDKTIPQNSESPTLGAQRIRETREAINTLLDVEHDITDESTKGFHGPNVTIPESASISTPPSNYGRFGVKEVSGVAELFYKDDAGNEKQITSGGKLNIVDADGAVVKTGAQTIAGVKTFSDSPVVPTPVGGTDAANKDFVTNNAVGQAFQANATDDATAHTSTDQLEDVPNMTLTPTFTGGAVLINFCGTFRKGSNSTVEFAIVVDSVVVKRLKFYDNASNAVDRKVSMQWLVTAGLTGSKNIKVQYNANAARTDVVFKSSTSNASRTLSVMELK